MINHVQIMTFLGSMVRECVEVLPHRRTTPEAGIAATVEPA
ncbi:hypothetical protein [Streptosporangium sp. V21-05]